MSLSGYRYYANQRAGAAFLVFLAVFAAVKTHSYVPRSWAELVEIVRAYRMNVLCGLLAVGMLWMLIKWIRSRRQVNWNRYARTFVGAVGAEEEPPALTIRPIGLDSSVGNDYLVKPYKRTNFNTFFPERDLKNSWDEQPETNPIYQKLSAISAFSFEKVVAWALGFEGYKVTELGEKMADGGIDLIAENTAGTPIGVQCKHYRYEEIGVEKMRSFVGALAVGGYRRGIYVTMVGFTRAAQDVAMQTNIELWDGTRLANVLRDNQQFWSVELGKLLHSMTPECPRCGIRMVLRRARRGPYAGQLFWGCDPRSCREIVQF